MSVFLYVIHHHLAPSSNGCALSAFLSSSTESFVSFNLSVKLKPYRLSATLPRVGPYEDYPLSATERLYMRTDNFERGVKEA